MTFFCASTGRHLKISPFKSGHRMNLFVWMRFRTTGIGLNGKGKSGSLSSINVHGSIADNRVTVNSQAKNSS